MGINLSNYFPALLFLLAATGLGVLVVTLGFILGPRKPDAAKLSAYECGFEAFDDARMRFDVRYYLIAILFILFDLETAFLVPWAVGLDKMGLTALAVMCLFLFELVVGYIYIWKKGALEWE